MKIGIGKHENQDLADFVLSRFSKDEQIDMEAAYLRLEAVETIIKEDINAAMNKFNIKIEPRINLGLGFCVY